jgi:hypothetical protein
MSEDFDDFQRELKNPVAPTIPPSMKRTLAHADLLDAISEINRLKAENAEMRTVLKRVASLAEVWFESDEENDVSLRDNWYGNRVIETLGKYAKEQQ